MHINKGWNSSQIKSCIESADFITVHHGLQLMIKISV